MTTIHRSAPATLLLLVAAVLAFRSAPLSRSAGTEPQPPGDEIRWLEERSMLRQAREAATLVSGQPLQWRHTYGAPEPRKAVRHASVWLLDYPGSVITQKGRSVIATWADPLLWDTLRDLHIDLLHTGPIHRAGGVKGTEYTPTTDGWFDPISLDLDPAIGTEAEYAKLIAVATERKGLLAGLPLLPPRLHIRAVLLAGPE